MNKSVLQLAMVTSRNYASGANLSRKSDVAVINPLRQRMNSAQISNVPHRSRIKNTDASMYASNPKHNQRCLLCRQCPTNLVHHFLTHHPNEEIFISRISREMRNRIMTIGLTGTRDLFGVIRCVCAFCEMEKCWSIHKWMQHLTSHTGEYMYKCTGCSNRFVSQQHDRVPDCPRMDVRNTFEIETRSKSAYAYICDKCNYIQFRKDALEKHVRFEHNVDGLEREQIMQQFHSIYLFDCHDADDRQH